MKIFQDLENTDIMGSLSSDNPDTNYNTFEDILTRSIEKHMPMKKN
jgi:capsid protein